MVFGVLVILINPNFIKFLTIYVILVDKKNVEIYLLNNKKIDKRKVIRSDLIIDYDFSKSSLM